MQKQSIQDAHVDVSIVMRSPLTRALASISRAAVLNVRGPDTRTRHGEGIFAIALEIMENVSLERTMLALSNLPSSLASSTLADGNGGAPEFEDVISTVACPDISPTGTFQQFEYTRGRHLREMKE